MCQRSFVSLHVTTALSSDLDIVEPSGMTGSTQPTTAGHNDYEQWRIHLAGDHRDTNFFFLLVTGAGGRP